MLFVLAFAIGLYGSCDECEPCVEYCGPRCLKSAFKTSVALPYDVPSAVEAYAAWMTTSGELDG